MHGTIPPTAVRRLFTPFDAYCAANPLLGPAAAARARITAVWGLWAALPVAAKLNGVPQLVGYYIDTHIPLILTAPAPASVQLVYKAGLQPEHQAHFPCTLDMMPEALGAREAEFRALIRTACPSNDGPIAPQTAPILKLIRKGFPNQASVRYIRPQFQRCNTTTASRALAVYIYRLAELGAYQHSTAIADVHTRLRIYGCRDATVFEAVARITSRSLYTMVAEPIAGVFRTDVALMLQAENQLGGIQPYVANLTGSPRSLPPMLDAPQAPCTTRTDKMTQRCLITQIPLAAEAAAAQTAIELATTGLRTRTAFCCRMCGIVHVRTDAPVPRTTKKHIGIALDLTTDDLVPHCNNCTLAIFVERITLTGYLTTACISATRREITSIVTCGGCARVITKPQWHRQTPFCPECFATKLRAVAASIVCVCGADRLPATNAFFMAATQEGTTAMHAPCAAHQFTLPTATTCPLTQVTVYKGFIGKTPALGGIKRKRFG